MLWVSKVGISGELSRLGTRLGTKAGLVAKVGNQAENQGRVGYQGWELVWRPRFADLPN